MMKRNLIKHLAWLVVFVMLWGMIPMAVFAENTEADAPAQTQEQLVVYQSEQDGQVYARPVAMFMEWIEHQGQVVSRFTPVA